MTQCGAAERNVSRTEQVFFGNQLDVDVGVRFLIAIEWMLTTTLALVLAHLAVEIAGATLLGYALLILLPFIGGAVGGAPVGVLQWVVLRRHIDDNGSWIGFTLLGFVAAWTGTIILAVALFAAPNGLDGFRLFLSFAIPAPIIGWSQSRVLASRLVSGFAGYAVDSSVGATRLGGALLEQLLEWH
jgi:hypothetical protein